MKFKRIGFQNLRSFGNELTEISFPEDIGELILFLGENGNGKSTISDAFDVNLFGKAKSKDGGSAKVATLANWYNNSFHTESEFENNNIEYSIIRSFQPNKFEIYEDNVLYDRMGKTNKQDHFEATIGIEFKTWRNFVNISVSDFKNFLSLKAADKRELIDKLFDLNKINELLEIAKFFKKETEIEFKVIEKSIESTNYSIQKLEKSIKQSEEDLKKAEDKNEDLLRAQIEQCKEKLASLKERNNELNNSLLPLTEKFTIHSNELASHAINYQDYKSQLIQVQKEIDLYKQGKCPTCSANFNSDHHIEHFKELTLKNENLKSKIKEIEILATELKQHKTESENKINSIKQEITTISGNARELQTQGKMYVEKLKEEPNNEFHNAIQTFKTSLNELKDKENILNDQIEATRRELLVLENIVKMLGEKGIKQEFIQNLIPNVNMWLKYFLNKLESQYTAEFDENFDAHIKNMNSDVDLDCLSRGEQRKVNLGVLLACLKIMRTQKYVNILFLDEVFESIDTVNIYLMLNIFKEFAQEHKIHIMLVHHADLEHTYFDRIYKVDKEIFSFLEQIK
jgi:exonuclease SbcC